MRKALLLLGLLSMAALASCSIKDDLQPEPAAHQFRGTLEQLVPDASTKAFAEFNSEQDKYYIYWNENDPISIFKESNLNRKYIFDGFDGAPSGTFTESEEGSDASGSDPIETDYQYAIFPYDKKFNSCTQYGALTVMIPAEQSVHDGDTPGVGARIFMVARDTEGDFSFKHVGSYIAATLKGEGVSVASISFRGNNSEIMAGLSTVTFDDNGEPVAVFESKYARYQSDAVTMNFETPVVLGSEETEFWLAVPSITLSKGYTLTVTDTNGGVFEKKTTSSLTLKRKNFYHCRANVDTTIPVSSITLNKDELNLSVGATETLVATVEPSNATDNTVTWTSSAESVATVDATGKVTAVAAGDAIITASAGDKSATCAVSVSDEVTYALTITPASATIKYNETQTYVVNLTTTTNGTAGTPVPVSATLTSDDTNVATVSGLVATGKKEGTAHISASYVVDGKTITTGTPATLNVEDVVTYALTITPVEATIKYNETQTYVVNLTTTTNGTAGTPVPVSATLTSDDTSVATVSGLVATGKKEGTAHISASYEVDGKTITTGTPATLNVEDVVTYALTITPVEATIKYNETQTYVVNLTTTTNGTAGTPIPVSATLTSDDTNVATVSGLVATGKKEGTAHISASYVVDGKTITTGTPATLNVEDVVTYALTITPVEATIKYNETQTYVVNLTTTTNGTAGTPVPVSATLTSDDTNVATVSGLVVTGKKEGTAHISASYEVDGKTITTGTPATLNVEDEVSYKLVIEPEEDAKVYLGQELQFKASLITITNGEEGTPAEIASGVTWSSSAPAIATIGETTGKAKGVKEGETTITATYTPSGSTSLSVEVTLKSSREPDHSGDPIGIGEEEEL